MAIRLNKAIRELNIGLQTAVEFLEKKINLGEVKGDLNFKLNDAQYEALVEEFKSDKEVRNQADKFLQKRPKEKKRVEPENHKGEDLLDSNRVKYKPLGKIDLDSIGRRPAPKAEPATPAVAQPTQKGTAAESPAPKATPESEKAVQPKQPATESPVESQTTVSTPKEPQPTEAKTAPQPVVAEQPKEESHSR